STHAPVVFSGGSAACVVLTGRAGIDGWRRHAPAPQSHRSSCVPVSRNWPWYAPSHARPPPPRITPPTPAVHRPRSRTAVPQSRPPGPADAPAGTVTAHRRRRPTGRAGGSGVAAGVPGSRSTTASVSPDVSYRPSYTRSTTLSVRGFRASPSGNVSVSGAVTATG